MNRKLKTTYYRTLFIPILISFALFVFIGYGVIRGIQEHFYNHMRDLSVNLASGYSYSIEKAITSGTIIEDLIEDKLISASQILSTLTTLNSHQSLISYAKVLNVDQINLFSAGGELLISTLNQELSWQAYEGHPIFEFIKSGKQSFIEPIRENSVTGVSYMYGYYRLQNGEVLQIGLLAYRVEAILGNINPQRALYEIVSAQNNIVKSCFISVNNLDSFCVNQNENYVLSQKKENSEFSFVQDTQGYISPEDASIYILYVPVKVQGEKLGTLVLHHQMNNQNLTLRQFVNLGVSLLIIVYALIAYMFILNAHKNKSVSTIAYIDSLSQLPNASYLSKIYQNFIESRTKNKVLALININEFKSINVTYGYHVGDDMLKEISRRLKKFISRDVSLFRWEGDRFVFLLSGIETKDEMNDFACKVLSCCEDHFQISNVNKKINLRIGLVEIDESRTLLQTIQQSMITLANEKTVDDAVIIFNNEIEQSIIREYKILEELQEIIAGVDQHRLYLMFQPQQCTVSSNVSSVEALARLSTNQYGAVGPAEFINIAEKHHLIYDLGKVIIEKAIQTVKQLNELNMGEVRIAINVSGIQILHDFFIADLFSLIDEYEIDARQLELEITESILMNDMNRINETLVLLREKGIMISIDDFGTGYSSFFTLSELSVDIVKINRSFVRQIHNHGALDQKIIAREIIQMVHKLDLKIVAEEVEFEDEYRYLKDNQCDYIQGYYVCRPLLPYDLFHYIQQANQ